jgi:hypothetical protein
MWLDVAVGDFNPAPFSHLPGTNEILYAHSSGNVWGGEIWTNGFSGSDNSTLDYLSSEFILRAVAFGSNGFVAGGDTGYTVEYNYPGVVLTSSNGVNWFEVPPFSEHDIYGCVYGNGLYVLVGDAGGIIVSSNLVDWAEVTAAHQSVIMAIGCAENLCVATARPIVHYSLPFPDFTLLVSTNGADWVATTSNVPPLTAMAGGGGEVVGISTNSFYGAYATDDGYNWQPISLPLRGLDGINYVNGRFFSVGDSGLIFISGNGIYWTNVSVATSGSFYGVAYGGGRYVAAGSVSAISTDGFSWTTNSMSPPENIIKIVYGDNQFVPVAASGDLLSSADGVSWQTNLVRRVADVFSDLAYNGGTFMVIFRDGAAFFPLRMGLIGSPKVRGCLWWMETGSIFIMAIMAGAPAFPR